MNEPTEKTIFYYMALFTIKHKFNYKRFINSIGESNGSLSRLKFTMYEIVKFLEYLQSKIGEVNKDYVEEVIDSELNYKLK